MCGGVSEADRKSINLRYLPCTPSVHSVYHWRRPTQIEVISAMMDCYRLLFNSTQVKIVVVSYG